MKAACTQISHNIKTSHKWCELHWQFGYSIYKHGTPHADVRGTEPVDAHDRHFSVRPSAWLHRGHPRWGLNCWTGTCCSSRCWWFPFTRQRSSTKRRNESVWSHLNSAGRLQLLEANLRGHNNIPGFVFYCQCTCASPPSCICCLPNSFYVTRCLILT